MRKPDDTGRLQDILDAIARIESYLRGTNEKEFGNDLMRQDAIIHQIEIIGEAGHNVSSEFQEQHPEVPWSEMIGMRNKIVRDYFEIDIPTVWKTAKKDLPPLKLAVAKLVKQVKG
jgi:uncharacterized protein with HEPN domain